MIRTVNQSTAARLLECNLESLRSLQRIGIVVPTENGYTFEQLVLSRVILLIRNAFQYRNFSFAKIFAAHKRDLDFNDVIGYCDSGFMINQAYESEVNKWLIDLEQEIDIAEITDEYQQMINKHFGIYPSKEMVFAIIPICRVQKYILKRLQHKELFSAPAVGGRPTKSYLMTRKASAIAGNPV